MQQAYYGAYRLVFECEFNGRHCFFVCVDIIVIVLTFVVITAAIGARKPATARHNDAFVNRDHSTSSAYTQITDNLLIY